MKIISTVPSLTELLSYLGLEEQLIGITKFCVHPDNIYHTKERTGGTKDLKLDRIKELRPDLIIANKEENEKEQIEALKKEFDVLVTDIHNLESALDTILEIGRRTEKYPEAEQLTQEIKEAFSQLLPTQSRRVLYLIWREPYMSIGHDTFIHDMLKRCGLHSVTAHLSRYPEVARGDFDPELILLSSEPYPFKEKHFEEVQKAWPESQLKLVDGEYFSWYGSRMLGAVEYYENFLKESLDP